MATKRLPMRQIREILRLKHEQKLSHRAIAGACRVGLGTVADYLGRARQAGLEWPLPEELDEAALEARLFPRAGPGSRERVAPDVERIHQELKRVGVTLHLLWEEYREANPKGYAYSQFCEIYRRWAQKLKPSMRQVHRAGEKTFIDFSGKRPQLTIQFVPLRITHHDFLHPVANHFVKPLGLRAFLQRHMQRPAQTLDQFTDRTRFGRHHRFQHDFPFGIHHRRHCRCLVHIQTHILSDQRQSKLPKEF